MLSLGSWTDQKLACFSVEMKDQALPLAFHHGCAGIWGNEEENT